MTAFETEKVKTIFEHQPAEVATWLISIDAMHALAIVVRNTRIIDHPDEIAAKRLIKSVGAGDYKTPLQYFSNPEIYPPGMLQLATKLGAYSLRNGLNGGLGAALSYKSNKEIRSNIDTHIAALELYDNASNFPLYFVKQAEERLNPTSYGSIVDTLLTIKNDTQYWIDRDVTS
ncbi:MAG: hypothetical protein ABIR46_00545 [Candidatus Saccharimonadales bacterium]